MTRIFKVVFACEQDGHYTPHYASDKVVARDAQEAIKKALTLNRKLRGLIPTSVELLAEA